MDEADADPVRFWSGFIEAIRVPEPWFGADAAELLAMDGSMSADVAASIANDAGKLSVGSAIVVDDFQYAADSTARDMTAVVERWPAESVQLVLSARVDPPLRLHRLRMAGELCELRDSDLSFSQAESRDLLANFGVQPTAADLALLHQRRAVTHRKVKNNRLASAGYTWAFSALTASPGARAHYDRRKDAGDRHTAAQRHLFGRLPGCLHHCLITGQDYDENIAFPQNPKKLPQAA